jgi:UDP-glucuronate 4-epimerase
MKILVTGAAGFVGSALCRELLAQGNKVVAIDNFNDYYSPTQKRNNITDILKNNSFKLYESDFCNKVALANIFESFRPDCVAHLGAMANVRYSVENPEIFGEVNVMGTLKILDACAKYGTKHVVFASTSSVYGQRENVPFYEEDSTDLPLAPYPATKKAGELLGHSYYNMYGITFTALRFFNVYGPCGRPDMMPFIVAKKILAGEEITIFDNGELKRDWTFVSDVVDGVIKAINKPLGYMVFNIGRGEPVILHEFISTIEEVIGKKAIVRNTVAPVSEPKQTYASIEKATRLIGYQPTVSFRDGYKLFWDWYRSISS